MKNGKGGLPLLFRGAGGRGKHECALQRIENGSFDAVDPGGETTALRYLDTDVQSGFTDAEPWRALGSEDDLLNLGLGERAGAEYAEEAGDGRDKRGCFHGGVRGGSRAGGNSRW